MGKAIVIGANNANSIGFAIAAELRTAGYEVLTPTHSELDVTKNSYTYMTKNANAQALVLSHGDTMMAQFGEADPAMVRHVIETNLTGTILTAQSFVKATKDSTDRFNRKAIVIIGSLGGERVFTNSSVYCATKAAVAHLGRCMAWELAPKGYDVFVIEPGNVFGTNISKKVANGMQYPSRFIEHETLHSIILPADIATVVADLIVKDQTRKWLAGEPIRLSGGAR